MTDSRVLSAPVRIWLVVGDAPLDGCEWFLDDATWCEDQINDSDVPYVRADAVTLANPLADLAAQTRAINVANGWGVLQPSDWEEDEHKVPAILALIHSEVSEALEEFRTGDLVAFREELADVLIRVLDAAAGLGIDLDAEVGAKLEKNRARGFRHGGKRV